MKLYTFHDMTGVEYPDDGYPENCGYYESEELRDQAIERYLQSSYDFDMNAAWEDFLSVMERYEAKNQDYSITWITKTLNRDFADMDWHLTERPGLIYKTETETNIDFWDHEYYD